jgi:hypothetical protein
MELYISLAAMIISLISVIVFVAIYLLGIQRDKKQDTLDSFNLLQEQVFDKLNLITYSEITNICKKVDSGSIDDETNSKYYELLGYLARLEHFSLGVNTGIYDAKTAERAGTAFLVSLRKKLLPVIELQEKRGNHNSDKRIEYYKEFRMLTERVAKYE